MKKKRLLDDLKDFESSADELAEAAEKSGDLTVLTKSNALRRSVQLKKKERPVLEKELAVTRKWLGLSAHNS